MDSNVPDSFILQKVALNILNNVASIRISLAPQEIKALSNKWLDFASFNTATCRNSLQKTGEIAMELLVIVDPVDSLQFRTIHFEISHTPPLSRLIAQRGEQWKSDP